MSGQRLLKPCCLEVPFSACDWKCKASDHLPQSLPAALLTFDQHRTQSIACMLLRWLFHAHPLHFQLRGMQSVTGVGLLCVKQVLDALMMDRKRV